MDWIIGFLVILFAIGLIIASIWLGVIRSRKELAHQHSLAELAEHNRHEEEMARIRQQGQTVIPPYPAPVQEDAQPLDYRGYYPMEQEQRRRVE